MTSWKKVASVVFDFILVQRLRKGGQSGLASVSDTGMLSVQALVASVMFPLNKTLRSDPLSAGPALAPPAID